MIPRRWLYQLENFRILAIYYGQYKTIKYNSCIDKNNNPIPWYTYPCIEYLNSLDFSSKRIFEYGSGNSSYYWSRKVQKIISVEDNKVWYEKVLTRLNKNQTILLRENTNDYVNAIIESNKKFDIIVIDGTARDECAKVIDNYLNKESKEGYMIILDNSNWIQLKDVTKYFREVLNLIQVDFHGFIPITSYTSVTSIFFSRNFNFKPLNHTQPTDPIGAYIPSSGANS